MLPMVAAITGNRKRCSKPIYNLLKNCLTYIKANANSLSADLHVNTSLPIGTDKQVNTAGIEMQRLQMCSGVGAGCYQSEIQICCLLHTFSPCRPTTSLSKSIFLFWTNLDILKKIG